MKSQKLIHLLLAIALVCGQLVANVHTMGHLQDDDCEALSFSPSIHCDNSLHAGLHHADAAEHLIDAPVADLAAEEDCSIYHALMGLNGLFCVSQKVAGTQVLQRANHFYAQFTPPASVRNTQLIRAPPAIV